MKNNFIPIAQPDLSGNEKKYLLDCLKSTWISSRGEYIDKFEKGFAKFTGSKYAVSTSNGTSALHLALVGLGIGYGDEVIMPDLTFIATANAVKYTGATPVFADVEGDSWNIDPEKIESKINKKTKAIMVVHLYGHPADMDLIGEIAQKYHLLVIEDAAEAHGAEVKINTNNPINTKNTRKTINRKNSEWKKVGSFGKVGCFSFYANKIITTGEGGMVTTDDEKLAQKMKIYRDHGQTPGRRYYHEVIGFNYRMTNIQAAIGLAQLERIGKFLIKKKQIAVWYDSYLKGIEGIKLYKEKPNMRSVNWLYSLLVTAPFPLNRDQLSKVILKYQIETRPFFYPLHMLPLYKSGDIFRNSERIAKCGLSLPSGVSLTEKDIKFISGIIRKEAGR